MTAREAWKEMNLEIGGIRFRDFEHGWNAAQKQKHYCIAPGCREEAAHRYCDEHMDKLREEVWGA